MGWIYCIATFVCYVWHQVENTYSETARNYISSDLYHIFLTHVEIHISDPFFLVLLSLQTTVPEDQFSPEPLNHPLIYYSQNPHIFHPVSNSHDLFSLSLVNAGSISLFEIPNKSVCERLICNKYQHQENHCPVG